MRKEKLSELLDESIQNTFGYEDSKLTIDENDFRELVNESGADLDEAKLPIYAQLVENTQKMIDETNFTPNIDGYTTKIQPLLRRIVPALLAWDVCGVQAVDIPTSAIFVLKADYSGSVDAPISMAKDGARIVILAVPLDAKPAVGDAVDFGGGVTGKYEFVQDEKTFVVKLDDVAKTPVVGTSKVDGKDLKAVYSNELAYKKVLKGYSGPHATFAGEKLGDDMNQLRIRVERQDISVETRKLKAEITQETIQDLKALHGVSAESEISMFLETEIRLEIDRSIIDKLKEVATIAPDFKVQESAGRWSMEMYEGLYQRISLEANRIAHTSRRGRGNRMITSPGVVSALQSLRRFKDIDTAGVTVNMPGNHSEVYVGTLQNGIEVYMDWFADDEYCLMTYKGMTNIDAGLVFSPYHLLTFTEVRDYKTHQPALGIMSRYALTPNGWTDDGRGVGSSTYTRLFSVDFTGTALAA